MYGRPGARLCAFQDPQEGRLSESGPNHRGPSDPDGRPLPAAATACVSVVIPNFNNAPYLERAIRSIADDPAVAEIIVYDNASTDGSVAVIESLGEPKVRLIRGTENIGAARARDRAVRTSGQPFLAFLDGDDFLAPDTISAGVAKAIAEDLDMCVPDHVAISEDETTRALIHPALQWAIDGGEGLARTLPHWEFAAARGIVRRATYLAAARDFEFHGHTDDELLTRRMVVQARRIGGAKGTYFYRKFDRPPPLPGQRAEWLQTLFRSIVLARAKGPEGTEPQLRKLRNEAARGLVSLVLEARRSLGRDRVRAVLADLDSTRLPWRPADWPTLALVTALRAALPVLVPRRADGGTGPTAAGHG